MPSTDTTVKFRADISDLKREMQAAQRQVKLVNSEFKAATAGMDDWTKSEEGLAAKIKQLNGILDSQKKKLALLNQQLELTEKAYGKDSAEADRVRISINNISAAIASNEKELKGYNQQLEELPKTMEDIDDAAEKASDGFTVFKGALADLVADGIRNVISGLKDLATEAINVGMSFESSMSNVEAISGATAEQMQQLTDKAMELSESSKFTATEIGDGFSYMAMAGWKTEEMLDGIEGIMNLAAASGTDLATASDIVTDALTAMGYSAQDSGRLADVMAAASSNANTNVELMGATFKYVAPIIGTLGYNMEDAAVAIGLMANAGIKGEKAGTALRSTLNRLSAPPKECAEEMERLGISLTDSEGNMKDLNTVITEMRIKFADLSETEATAAAKHIAGQEAMSGLLAIMNASNEDFQKLTVAINDSSGAAATMAETMQDNVGGKLTLLQSKIQGIMIRLFKKASDSMKDGIDTVGEALDKVNWDKVGDQIGKFATKAADLFSYIIRNSSTIIGVLKTIGSIFATVFVANKVVSTAKAVTTLVNAFKSAQSATQLFSTACEVLGISMSAIPVMALIAALGAVYTIMKQSEAAAEDYAQSTYGLTEKQQELVDAIDASAEAVKRSNEAFADEGSNLDYAYGKLGDLKDQYNALIDENGNVKEGSEELAETLLGQLAEGLGITIENVKENIDANGQLSASIDELIQKKKDEAKLSAFEDDYREALKNEVQYFQKLKGAKEEQKAAQENLNKAQADYNQAMEDLSKMDAWGALAVSATELPKYTKGLEEAQQTYDDVTQSVKTASETWGSARSTIEHYQEALTASTEGNADKMNSALLKMQGGITDSTVASKDQLQEQYLNTKSQLSDIQELYDQGIATDEMVNSYKRITEEAGAELDEWVAKNEEAGKEGVEGFVSSASDQLGNAYDVAEQLGSGSSLSLINGLGDWGQIATDKTGDYLGIIEGKKSEANKTGEDFGEETAKGAKSKVPDFVEAAQLSTEGYTGEIEGSENIFKKTGNFMTEKTAAGAEEKKTEMEAPAEHSVTTFTDVINNNASQANEAGGNLAAEAAAGAGSNTSDFETSGTNAAQGFINAIIAKAKEAWNAGLTLAKNAIGGVKKGQQEGSPSKLTYKSGQMFTLGYINGIVSMEQQLANATKSLVSVALQELLKLNNFDFSNVSENASSVISSGISEKMDYMLSRMKYENEQKIKDFDNTIEELQNASDAKAESLQKASEKKQTKLQKESEKTQKALQKASDQAVASIKKASAAKQEAIQNQIDHLEKEKQNDETKKKIKELKEALKNEKSLMSTRVKAQQDQVKKSIKAEQDALKKQIKAEEEASKKAIEASKETYEEQIKEQEKMRDAYEQASESMISEFSKAMSAYQTAAQKLIDDTMNAITDKYQSKYDALMDKQDNLIEKLKSAGDLFSLSGANVMTINDINAQTAAIKQYADKLSKIKQRVSGDLFDQIASYDMKEGEAFIDRLLAMSEKELQAYSDAYDEKMRVSESLSENIYKKDFDKVASDYEKAVKEAFADLPAELEQLGYDTMAGFLSGLTTNTDYMEDAVKTFVSGMVDTFKKQLGIASPSKVTMKIGELVGEGFADGILDMVKTVKAAAKEVTDAVTTSLDMDGSLSQAKSAIYSSEQAAGIGRSSGNFSGDNTQIINFNQYNNSPKALDRLAIYRQTNNMLFSAKVGLSNV